MFITLRCVKFLILGVTLIDGAKMVFVCMEYEC